MDSYFLEKEGLFSVSTVTKLYSVRSIDGQNTC